LAGAALANGQTVIDRPFNRRFQVYVADTLFEEPFTNRRGFSLPDKGRLLLLYDGSGSPTERLYIATYALTHLIAAQTLGEAAAPLLSEGLAVLAGAHAVENDTPQGRRYLSPKDFCAAYEQTGNLPRISRELIFEGHLGYLDQYFAAGCFVGYLIEEEGASAFSEVYLSGDYSTVYGRSLSALESEWITLLRDAADDLTFAPEDLVDITTKIDAAYRSLWADFEGTPDQFAVYKQLDRARLALLQGRLGVAQEHLETLNTLLGEE
jgi:hypothetical protein